MVNLSGFTAKPYGAHILCCTDVQDSAFRGVTKTKISFSSQMYSNLMELQVYLIWCCHRHWKIWSQLIPVCSMLYEKIKTKMSISSKFLLIPLKSVLNEIMTDRYAIQMTACM